MNSIYEYDRQRLEEYAQCKKLVEELQLTLENEHTQLEADRAQMQEQSAYLDKLLDEKRAASANFDAQIAKAKQEAAVYKTKIKQEEAKLKKMKEEERRKQTAANTNNITVTKFDVSIIDKAPGCLLYTSPSPRDS